MGSDSTDIPADFRIRLPARAENVAVVRHVLGVLADSIGMHRAAVEDLRLAVTEACTNVVRHAYDGTPGPMEVQVRPDRRLVEVTVTDEGRGLEGSLDLAGPRLGMPLMAALADSVEVSPRSHGGSRVRMCFGLDDAGSRPA